jgi:uncharacterized iron-regulated membrane protein
MTLRTVLFWPHLIAGVIAGAIILVMSVTGVLLTYERQLIAWSDSHLTSTPPHEGATRLEVGQLLSALQRERPAVEASAITISSDPKDPVAVTSGRDVLYVDAYSGRVLGEAAQGVRRLMSELRSWHRWLAVEGEGRPVARAITGWSNALFLFIVASGIYLWFPRKWSWQHVRPVVFFTGRLRGKARDFNWHNVIGAWSAIPLFIVVLTALPISFPWANNLVYRAAGEQPPAVGRGGREGGPRAGGPGREGGPREGRGRVAERPESQGSQVGERVRAATRPSLDDLARLWDVAERQVPGWRTINLRVPTSDDAPVVFAIDRGDGGQPQLRSTLTLDRATGAVVAFETFSDQSLGRRLRSLARFAHTGEVLGLPGQTLAGLVTAGSVVLVWTGIALSLRRFRSWVRRRRESDLRQADRQRVPAT